MAIFLLKIKNHYSKTWISHEPRLEYYFVEWKKIRPNGKFSVLTTVFRRIVSALEYLLWSQRPGSNGRHRMVFLTIDLTFFFQFQAIGTLHIFCCMDHENYRKITRNPQPKKLKPVKKHLKRRKWKREFRIILHQFYLKYWKNREVMMIVVQ